nr:hypothetical protein [Tanacetum cinerariifolium]
EARIQKEEEADELYRDININQKRGLQVTQNVEDSHVTLTPVNPDGPQETFRFDERLRSLETSFSEYRQTNLFVDAVSAIPALDESLVPSTQRLRIGRSNFRLPSDIQSKESTLQVFYDVLRNSLLFRAFQVTADVPEIYMQEFWARAKLHHNSIRFKIDTKKSVLDLEAFREMLHIISDCLKHKFCRDFITESTLTLPILSGKILCIRDDVLFSTIKVVLRHQTTQQYGAILPTELTTDEIRNSKAYKEYYACAIGEAAPKPKVSAKKKKGDSASSTTPPTPTPTTTVVSAPRLSATAKVKVKVNDEEETRQEEEGSFDPIPRTPKGREEESNDEEDKELRLSEEARIQKEEEADELYRDESSSMSSFVTSMLNPTSDVRVESIFTTASSPIVSLQTPTPIMTPSTIATITTSRDAPIPPTIIPSIILENLPTFNSAFRFDERLRSLETTFSEYRQTNPFVDVVSAIPGIVHQYMTQQMTKAVREAVQIQTDRLQDSLQR